jgi:hypothetical protein
MFCRMWTRSSSASGRITVLGEGLLVKHWGALGRSPLFIQVALYFGTARCRELAAESLAEMGPGADPFKHVGAFFGFFTQGLMDRLTTRHLDTLLPYLAQIDDTCLGDMLEFCRRFDHWAWAKRHLEPELRRRVPLVERDLGSGEPYIVRETRQGNRRDLEALLKLKPAGDEPEVIRATGEAEYAVKRRLLD